MASKKLFRINKNNILEVNTVSNYWVEMAFKLGYVFITEKNKEGTYMINTTTTKKSFSVNLVENIEIV